MSWKMEFFADNEWVGNGIRYATEQEAIDAGTELLSRWFVPSDSRAVGSDEPVNYKFENWHNVPLDKT